MGNKINLEVWYKINDYIIIWVEECILSWNRRVLREKVKCICWNELFVRKDHLLSWRSKNCWCKKVERFRILWLKNKTHWMEWTRICNIFRSMKRRCNVKKTAWYKNYWWRWIKCEWSSFEEFYRDMWKEYHNSILLNWEKNTTLDRIDVNWNYCKDNCRWATWKIQQNNKRSNRLIEYRWEIKTLSQLEELWFWKRIVNDRIKAWWDIESAINEPPRKRITK